MNARSIQRVANQEQTSGWQRPISIGRRVNCSIGGGEIVELGIGGAVCGEGKYQAFSRVATLVGCAIERVVGQDKPVAWFNSFGLRLIVRSGETMGDRKTGPVGVHRKHHAPTAGPAAAGSPIKNVAGSNQS